MNIADILWQEAPNASCLSKYTFPSSTSCTPEGTMLLKATCAFSSLTPAPALTLTSAPAPAPAPTLTPAPTLAPSDLRCSSRYSACPSSSSDSTIIAPFYRVAPNCRIGDQLSPNGVAWQIDQLIGNPAKLSRYLSEVYAELATCQEEEEEKEEETRQLQRTSIKKFRHLSEVYAELATRQEEEGQEEKEKQEEDIRQLRWTPAKYSCRLSEAYADLVTRQEEEEEKEKEEEEEEEEVYDTITVTASRPLNVVHPNSQEPIRSPNRTFYSQEEKDFVRYYRRDLNYSWSKIAVAFGKRFSKAMCERNVYHRSKVPKYNKNGKIAKKKTKTALMTDYHYDAKSRDYSLLHMYPGRAQTYPWLKKRHRRNAKAHIQEKSDEQREFEFSMALQNIPREEYEEGLIWLQSTKKGS